MITYQTGNLLAAETEALVNAVNTVGVMGKGIALQFKEQYPEHFKLYAAAVKNGEVQTGKMFVTTRNQTDRARHIINFPTKTEWIRPSKYEYVEEGLKDLVRVIREKEISSIAIPALGCGNGKLKWEKVKPMMEAYLAPLDGVDVRIYQPDEAVKTLKQEVKKRRT